MSFEGPDDFSGGEGGELGNGSLDGFEPPLPPIDGLSGGDVGGETTPGVPSFEDPGLAPLNGESEVGGKPSEEGEGGQDKSGGEGGDEESGGDKSGQSSQEKLKEALNEAASERTPPGVEGSKNILPELGPTLKTQWGQLFRLKSALKASMKEG